MNVKADSQTVEYFDDEADVDPSQRPKQKPVAWVYGLLDVSSDVEQSLLRKATMADSAAASSLLLYLVLAHSATYGAVKLASPKDLFVPAHWNSGEAMQCLVACAKQIADSRKGIDHCVTRKVAKEIAEAIGNFTVFFPPKVQAEFIKTLQSGNSTL